MILNDKSVTEQAAAKFILFDAQTVLACEAIDLAMRLESQISSAESKASGTGLG